MFNKECWERNVMTSFRILSFFACFLRYFPDNDFGTLAFLFVQSCLCVTFTSWSTPSFEMLLSKLSNRNTHVCTSSIRMISFFTLQCELFTSCNVSNNSSLVSAWTGGGVMINQMWTGLYRERGVPKIPKFVRTSFLLNKFI